MDSQQPNQHGNHSGIVWKSLIAVIGMLVFVFAGLVPMYNLICEWTGLTGNPGGQYQPSAAELKVNGNRNIKVQFLTTNHIDMPWEFRPVENFVTVHPGQLATVFFYARNITQHTMIGQAVPSLSPFQVTEYFHKTECFCFEQQPLQAGEEITMGLRFLVDLDIPEDIQTITLSYTLFDITQMAKAN